MSKTLIAVTVLAALLTASPSGLALEPGGSFTDDNGSIHEPAIEAIADEGITKGCNPAEGNTRFCPKDAVTREQMATFLVRALSLPPAAPSFIDLGTSVHAADIGALAAAGITKGCNPAEGNTRFCPKDPVTREQMASFLTRALGLDASPRLVVTEMGDLFDLPMGSDEEAVLSEVTDLYGNPTADLDWKCPYFLSEPNMRLLRWGSLVAVIRTVDTGTGDLGLVGWRYKLDGSGQPEAGGPEAEHVEMPFGLELGDPIGDATAAGGGPVTVPGHGLWMVVELDDFSVEASGLVADPNALIDGVQQGVGFDCE